MKPNKYFIDLNGVIYFVSSDGKSSNHPNNFFINNNKISILSNDKTTTNEYLLWDNLFALAAQITPIPNLANNDELHIDTAIATIHKELEDFLAYWKTNHKINPENWPLTTTQDNAGSYFEQFSMFDPSKHHI